MNADVNGLLNDITESLLLSEELELQESASNLASLLEDVGYEFDGATYDDLMEAAVEFICSPEFSELSEEEQSKIKKGFKMVFGKLRKIGQGLKKDIGKKALALGTAAAIATGAMGGHHGSKHSDDEGPKTTVTKIEKQKKHDDEPEHGHFKTKTSYQKNLPSLSMAPKKTAAPLKTKAFKS